LAHFLTHVSDGFILAGEDEVVTVANPAADRIFGVAPGALRGRCLLDFLDEDQTRLIRQKTAERKAGQRDAYELRIRRPSGEVRYVWVTAIPELDSDLGFQGAAGLFRDLTGRKRTELALSRSEARFRKLVDEAPVAVALLREGRFLHASASWVTLFGFTELRDLGERTLLDLVHTEEASALATSPLLCPCGSEDQAAFTYRALRRDGGVFLVATEVRWLELEDGPAALAFFRDITEERRVEAEREALIRDLRKALDEVQVLSGLLPVCSYCRKVRDDQGYWSRFEAYLEARTQASCSHGICPDCLREHFPEIAES